MTTSKKGSLSAVSICILLCGCASPQTSPLSISSPSAAPSASSTAPVDNNNKIVIYTPHDADPMNAAITSFMTAYPDIKVEVLAGGTGELVAKIREEAENPVADVLWGGGADSLASNADLFEPYICANDAYIDPSFKAADHTWTGESPLPMVIIYNKKLLAAAGLEAPTSWQDCLKPEFKGKIAYCQPSKSGSAYTQLCTMILANGGVEEGWNYVDQFLANIDGNILESSSKCHKLVANGEFLIGITIEKSAVTYADNPDIGYCYPSEGTSAVPDADSIVKNCPHEKNAQLFVDYVTSAACQIEQSKDWSRRPVRSDLTPSGNLALLNEIHLVDYDVDWSAQNKDKILEKFDELLAAHTK